MACPLVPTPWCLPLTLLSGKPPEAWGFVEKDTGCAVDAWEPLRGALPSPSDWALSLGR